jgi:hypothetical protein
MSVRPEPSLRLRKKTLSGTGTLHAAGKTGTQATNISLPWIIFSSIYIIASWRPDLVNLKQGWTLGACFGPA